MLLKRLKVVKQDVLKKILHPGAQGLSLLEMSAIAEKIISISMERECYISINKYVC